MAGASGGLSTLARPETASLALRDTDAHRPAEHCLLDGGRLTPSILAERLRIDWNFSPAQKLQTFQEAGFFNQLTGAAPLALALIAFLAGEEG